MAALTSLALGAASGIAGAVGKGGSSSTSRSMAGPSALERDAETSNIQSLQGMSSMVNAGPGVGDVQAGSQSQRDLAAMLQQYQEGGNIPTGQDISRAENYASQQFGAQRLGIQQQFQDAQQQYAQQAQIQGRNTLDPVFRNKQNIEMQRQMQMLGAQQGQFASQFAQQQPGQRLNFAGQRASVLGGLASQAMANRQALLQMGNQIQQGQQNFRLGASGSQTQSSQGGGLGGAIAGGIAGLGTAAQTAQGLQSLFSGGGSSTSIPAIGGGFGGSQFGGYA